VSRNDCYSESGEPGIVRAAAVMEPGWTWLKAIASPLPNKLKSIDSSAVGHGFIGQFRISLTQ
jgi:hypothetical protein